MLYKRTAMFDCRSRNFFMKLCNNNKNYKKSSISCWNYNNKLNRSCQQITYNILPNNKVKCIFLIFIPALEFVYLKKFLTRIGQYGLFRLWFWMAPGPLNPRTTQPGQLNPNNSTQDNSTHGQLNPGQFNPYNSNKKSIGLFLALGPNNSTHSLGWVVLGWVVRGLSGPGADFIPYRLLWQKNFQRLVPNSYPL